MGMLVLVSSACSLAKRKTKEKTKEKEKEVEQEDGVICVRLCKHSLLPACGISAAKRKFS